MKHLSIKLKVTLWFSVLMLAVILVVLAVLFSIGRHIITTATKNELMTTVEESRSDIEYDNGFLDFDDDIKSFDNGISLSVYNENKQLLYGRSPAGFPVNTSYQHGEVRLVQKGDFSWYVYDMEYYQDGYGTLWVRGVLAAGGSNNLFSRLFTVSFLLFPLTILLAAGGAFFITRRAFQPIREIVKTAEDITAHGSLAQRINLGSGKDEIHTLAAAFNKMFDTLQQSFEKERQFAADASHELRTPLSVMVAECEYAVSNQSLTIEEAREALYNILGRSQQMTLLVSRMLEIQRTERVKVHFEEVNLSELAETVAEQIKESAAEKQIAVTYSISPLLYVWGDEMLLIRLLWNLLENGLKYGRENGTLHLALYAKGNHVVVTVKDNGIGIDPVFLHRIWDRFSRADKARGVDGFGLGLPLCKRIVDAHQGTITAQSTLGEGSCFTFTLPKADAPH